MSERERFEHWFEHEANVRMSDLPENEAWYIWQARARIAEQEKAELVALATKLRDLEDAAAQASVVNQGQAMDGFALLANYRALADKARAILAKTRTGESR